MRGVLRIKSARVPFRRAGLTFGASASLVDIRTLDGARLLALAREPLLSIEIGDGEGGFRPLPHFDAGMTAEHAQMIIDSTIEELGPIDAGAEPAATTDAGDDALQAQLRQQAELIERQNDDLAKLRDLASEAGRVQADLIRTIEQQNADMDEARTRLADAEREVTALRDSTVDAEGIIKTLRAEIATLKAPKPAKAAKVAKTETATD
ncbi:hypothetical protein [Sphingomonas hengshuiensis]|uniref:Uncharacterized protein n=1 Tax=Sphingomonas hengshuiensis TaxID=1609977 RepID=A0A7U4LG38_9SPHN|nr:hypothetical protein [Sphingomonas hengshuiensis]AJP73164.1 hypothetical protein TS85_17255 [Sphingomonas hengshuiensis]